MCDSFDQAYCLKCNSGLLVYNGECVASCPFNYKVNFMETACEPLQDFPLIYFPHLIACIILIAIVFAAYFKDRKSLIISNIILFCGPVEFISYVV